MRTQFRFNGVGTLRLGLACLLVASVPAFAADEEPTFSLSLDPVILEGLSNSTDGDDAKFEEYRDLGSGFRIPYLHLLGESKDGNRTLDFSIVNGGRDDARYTLEYGLAGSWSMLLDYNMIQHRFGDDAHTLYTRTHPGVYEISDTAQRAVEAAIAAQGSAATGSILAPLFAVAPSVNLGLERDRGKVRLDLGKRGNLRWSLDYEHENRTGLRAGGAAFGFGLANEIAEPIDDQTQNAGIGGEWLGHAGSLAFGYRYSQYTNDISTLIWDNPLRAPTSTQARGIEDLPADNNAGTAYITGRVKFGGDWWANGDVNFTRMTQDDKLLAYTINPNVVGRHEDGTTFDASNPANLPQARAGQQADVLNISGNLGTTFGDSVRLKFRYRYYDYNNQSDRIEFPGVVVFHAATFTAEPRITVPYAYKNDDIGAELNWDVFTASTLSFSYDRKSINRQFREVASSDEDVFRVAFDSHFAEAFTLRAGYEHADRSIDGYRLSAELDTFVEGGLPANFPGLRQFYQAAKKTDEGSFDLEWQIGETLSLQGTYKFGKDDYDESTHGLLDSDFGILSAELDWSTSDANLLYLWASHEDRTSNQRSRQSGAVLSINPNDDWTFKADEKNDSAGLGWTSKLATKWTLDLSGEYSKARGKGDFTATPGGLPLGGTPVRTAALDLGNYDNSELKALRVKLDYAFNARLGVGLWYLYEDYNQDTFRLQGITGNFLPGTTIALNPAVGDYTGQIVGLFLKLTL